MMQRNTRRIAKNPKESYVLVMLQTSVLRLRFAALGFQSFRQESFSSGDFGFMAS